MLNMSTFGLSQATSDGRVKEVIVDSRINKVLAMRTDSIQMLEALDSISEFYVANTIEARRSLRQDLELQNISLAKKFITEFDDVKIRLEAAADFSQDLESACKRLADRVAEADQNMKLFMSKAADLEFKRNSFIQQSKEIQSFLAKFQLSEDEIEVLHRRDLDSPKAARLFFSALQRLQAAYSECKEIVEKHCFSAGFELLDMLGQHQDLAYQRLYEWVKLQCEALAESAGDDDSDILLQIAIRHLRKVPVYFSQCQDIVVASRRSYLVQKFVLALTQGGSSGSLGVMRAIDMHAHDAVRYVGDMLAWMHQAVASEEEFLQSVFGSNQNNGATLSPRSSSPSKQKQSNSDNFFLEVPSADNTEPMGLSVEELLSRCLHGLGRPLRTRIAQTLESRAGLDVLYTLTDLLTFYEKTFARLVKVENAVHSAVKGCLLESKRLFLGMLNKQAEAMTQTASSYPLDLTASLLTKECCKQIQEVLRVYAEALSPLPTEDPSDGCHIQAVLGNIIQPLLQACRMTGQSLQQADTAIFMLNNVSAIQGELKEASARLRLGYSSSADNADGSLSATKVWLELLGTEAEIWVGVLVAQEAQRTLHRSDMDKLVELIEVLPVGLRAVDQVGLDQDRVATILRAFYSSLLSAFAPQFEKLQDPDVREITRLRSAQEIGNAYDRVFNFVTNPDNGYNASVLSHSTDEVKYYKSKQMRALADVPIEGSKVVSIKSAKDFKEQMDTASEMGAIVVVDFFATWCPPCLAAAPVYAKMSKEYCQDESKCQFWKVDVDQCQEIARNCGISSMPTFQIYSKGQKVDDMVGFAEHRLANLLRKHM